MKLLERKIIMFVRSIDASIGIVFHDGDMESEAENKRLFINIDEFLYTYDDEPDHIQVMKEKGFIIDIMLPTYILLHEIGHVKMREQYANAKLLDYHYDYEVNKLVKEYQGLERLRKYKSLKLEHDADRYAYNYYIHNYDKVKIFDNIIREMLTAK
jgi:hypothetical protein